MKSSKSWSLCWKNFYFLIVVCFFVTSQVQSHEVKNSGSDHMDLLSELKGQLAKQQHSFLSKTKLESHDVQQLYMELLKPESIFRTVAAATDANSTIECLESVIAALQLPSRPWAVRMFDATGKPGSTGIYDGNLHAIGSYEECVNLHLINETINLGSLGAIVLPEIRGQYLLATLYPVASSKVSQAFHQLALSRIDNSGSLHDDFGFPGNDSLFKDFALGLFFGAPRLGICLPSQCSAKTAEVAVNVLLQAVLNLTGIHLEGLNFVYSIGDYHYTSENNSELSAGAITALSVLSVFLLLAIVGTALDVMSKSKPKDILSRIFLCFSIYTNGEKLLSTKKVAGSIDCVNGIRLFSMMWVVLGHTWYTANFSPWTNPLSVLDIYNDTGMMLILGATVAVDTFFFLSGFLFAYLMMKQLDKTKGRPHILLSYLHRYIRLTPAYGLVMLMFSTLSVYVGNGPLWQFMINERAKCEKNWWANLLYINNYIDTKNMCMGESWYLACDFQLFLIGPLLVWPMWKFPKAGLVTVIGVLAASVTIPGVLTSVNDWPAQVTGTRLSEDWFSEYYIRTYTRASPYIFGILFGFFMYHYMLEKRKQLPILINVAGWSIGTTLSLVSLLGLKKHWEIDLTCIDQSCADIATNSAYAALGRLTWAVGLSWVVFACSTGNGGIINRFLSWRVFAPLSRLTFCTYLIHLHMMFIFHFGRHDVLEFGQYLLVYFFFAHLILSFGFATVCTLLFESPFIGLERIVFGREGGAGGPPKQEQQKTPEVEEKKEKDHEMSSEKTTTNGVTLKPSIKTLEDKI